MVKLEINICIRSVAYKPHKIISENEFVFFNYWWLHYKENDHVFVADAQPLHHIFMVSFIAPFSYIGEFFGTKSLWWVSLLTCDLLVLKNQDDLLVVFHPPFFRSRLISGGVIFGDLCSLKGAHSSWMESRNKMKIQQIKLLWMKGVAKERETKFLH